MDYYGAPRRNTGFSDYGNFSHEENNSHRASREPESGGSGAGLSWLDDVDNLNLPSRTFYKESDKKPEPPSEEITNKHSFNPHNPARNDSDRFNKEPEIDPIKQVRMQAELDRAKNNKEKLNSKVLLSYVHKIPFNSLGLGKKIGQGGFSEIYESTWLNFPVAVKIIFDPNVNDALMEEFNNEIEKLFILRHPNIIQLYGICDKGQKLAVVTEIAKKGSLFDFLHKDPKNKNLSLAFKNRITLQLISTMYYIHSSGFVHRDLKTQNILLDKNLDMKMCDFGLTKAKSELNSGSGQFAGTPCYMAPELFERKFYDEKVDVFAFGTVLWEIYTQKIPYFNCEASEIKQYVTKGEKLICPSSVPKPIVNLIDKCRSVKAADRPSFAEILEMNIM